MSKPFKFRLERLRELREQQVDAARKEFADATQLLIQAQERHQRIIAEKLNLQRRGQQACGAFQPQDFVQYQHAIAMLLSTERKSSENVAERQAAQLQSKAALDFTMSKLKALEKLRDKVRARHSAEATRQEQATLDEFAVSQSGAR